MRYEIFSILKNWTLIVESSIAENADSRSETEIWRDEVGLLTLSRTDRDNPNRFRFRFSDEVVLDILADQHLIIDISPLAADSSSNRDHFLADQLFPRLLAHEGNFVLHAGASSIGDRAIILMGASGRGKSTLAASFNQSGGSLIGDDALIVSLQDGVFHVSAVYPSLRLMPDSVDALFSETPASIGVATYTSKQRITLPVTADPEPRPVRIAAIFVLAEPTAGEGIDLRRLTIAESCMALIENSFALDPTDAQRARKRLEAASELAREVPAFEISFPRDYARLPDVRSAILTQLA